MNNFKFNYVLAAVAVKKSRPDPAFLNKRQPAPTPAIHRAKPAAVSMEHSEWWGNISKDKQEKYLKAHPKSRKHASFKQKMQEVQRKTLDQKHQHITPKDAPEPEQPKKYNIVYPKHDTLSPKENARQQKEFEKKRDEEAALFRKHREAPGHNKTLAFLTRVGRVKPDTKSMIGLETKEKNRIKKEYGDFVRTFGKMEIEDLNNAADKYYSENPDHAKEDKIRYNKIDGPQGVGIQDDVSDEAVEESKNEAETSDVAASPSLLQKTSEAYDKNPMKNMPKKERDSKISAAVSSMRKGFSANTNSIVDHAYQFLNKDQIEALEECSRKAMKDNLTGKKSKVKPSDGKLLSLVGCAIATAAGMALGGPALGMEIFHHTAPILYKDGHFKDVIHNALCGKKADGSDDPDFNAHEDAVEKIIKSLKRQLTLADDKSKKENLKHVINTLERSKDNYKHS